MPVTMTKNPSFIEEMGLLPDPRVPGKVVYPLSEILLVVLAGILCGMDDWEEMTHHLDYPPGTPGDAATENRRNGTSSL